MRVAGGMEEGAENPLASKVMAGMQDFFSNAGKQAEFIAKINDAAEKLGKTFTEQVLTDFMKTGPTAEALAKLTAAASGYDKIAESVRKLSEGLAKLKRDTAEMWQGAGKWSDELLADEQKRKEQAKSIRESVDPLFAYQEEIKKLQSLYEGYDIKNPLSKETYDKAAAAAQKKALGAMMAEIPTFQLPSGPERGSSAAFTQIAQAQGGGQSAQIQLFTEMLDQANETAKNTKKMADKPDNPVAGPVP